jgi:excisionase family DNA binding protein
MANIHGGRPAEAGGAGRGVPAAGGTGVLAPPRAGGMAGPVGGLGTILAAGVVRGPVFSAAVVAAARLGVSRGYLSRLARTGQIPALRPGTDHYYVPADVVLPERTCQQCGGSLVGLAKTRVYCDRCRAERRGTRARP